MKNIRVLHLAEEYLPPSQIWFYNLLKATKADCVHHIATRRILPHNFFDPEFKVVRSQLGEYKTQLMALDGNAVQNYWAHLLLMPQRLVLPSERKQWLAYAKANKIELIHAHFAPHACEHLHWIAESRLPFAVSFYGYDYEKVPFVRPAYLARYKALFAAATVVICEGPHGVDTLARMGCPKEKLSIVPLGIQTDEWKATAFAPKPKDKLRLIQLADFTPKKGQLETLKAALIAKKRLPDLRLTLVGGARDQEYFQQCQTWIKNAQASDWISYHPFVNYSELREILLDHDVFVHPSRYSKQMDCEGGAPTILFNAQCLGLPVISTLHCDIPHVVKQGTSGRLVAEGAIEALADEMIRFGQMEEAVFLKWQQATAQWGKQIGNLSVGANRLKEIYQSITNRATNE